MKLEEKARALYMVAGIDLICLSTDGELIFSFIGYERQTLFTASQPLIREMYHEIIAAKQLFCSFFSSELSMYYSLVVKDETEQSRFMILGPVKVQSPKYNKEIIGSVPVQNTEQIVYLGRLFYWTYYSDESASIPEPVVLLLKSAKSSPIHPEISLFHLYYGQEPLHITFEEYHHLKDLMHKGDLSQLGWHLDSMASLQEGVNRFSLAKGDILRSAKNHFIATCAIVCTIAIEVGLENEYARTISYRFIERVEDARTRAEIVFLMKEMIITFTTAIKQYVNSAYSALLKEIIRYLHLHFFEKITLKEVAEHFNKHPSYISSRINRETGMSFSDNLNSIRIAESKRLLADTQMSIHEIAIAVGYDYQNHFSKIFKKITGQTPLQYRNQSRRLS